LTGGVPGDLSVRAPAAAAAAAAAARCRDLDSLGGGGGPCSGVLRHASHLQCSPQLTPACAPAQAQSSCTERAPEAVCRVDTRVAAGRALELQERSACDNPVLLDRGVGSKLILQHLSGQNKVTCADRDHLLERPVSELEEICKRGGNQFQGTARSQTRKRGCSHTAAMRFALQRGRV